MSKENRFGGTRVKVVGDPASLPLEIEITGQRRGILFNLVLAGAAGLFAVNFNNLVPAYMLEAYATIAKLLPWVLGLLALYFVVRAVLPLMQRRRVLIDESSVVMKATGPLVSSWQEPLENYRGIRWRRLVIDTGSTASRSRDVQRYRHILDLVHEDAGKTIPLLLDSTGRADMGASLKLAKQAFTTPNPTEAEKAEMEAEAKRLGRQASADNPREHWERWAALLGLPAIDARDGVEEVRQVEDLDQSIRDLAGEGRVTHQWQGDPPPSSLEVETMGDPSDPAQRRLQVLIRASRAKIVVLPLAGIGALMLIVGLFQLAGGLLLGGALFAGAAFFIWRLGKDNPGRLTITRDQLQFEDPNVARRSFSLPLATIESVQIRDMDSERAQGNTLKLQGRELLISSDQGEYPLGGGLNDEALGWLRDYVLAAIADA